MKSRLIFLALCIAAPMAARAQDTPKIVPVVFHLPPQDFRDERLAEQMREALSNVPGFNLMSKVSPDALVITIPDGLGRDGHEEQTHYSFTVYFSHNGDKIGQSLEACKASALPDCATQFAADAQSAAAAMR